MLNHFFILNQFRFLFLFINKKKILEEIDLKKEMDS